MVSKLFCPILFLFIYSFTGTSCSKNEPVTPAPEPTPVNPPASRKYLALGDCYTIGQGVSASERFPLFIATALRAQNISIGDPRYIAQTGWTTQNLMDAIQRENPPSDFDVVTLLIGVNDQYQGLDTGGYRVRFTQLLAKSILLAGNRRERVFVLSIPDYSATPFVPASDKARVSREIDWFNAINKEVTLQYGISYTDITPSTRAASQDASLLASDGLHYSAKEHRKWADMVAPKIRSVLQ